MRSDGSKDASHSSEPLPSTSWVPGSVPSTLHARWLLGPSTAYEAGPILCQSSRREIRSSGHLNDLPETMSKHGTVRSHTRLAGWLVGSYGLIHHDMACTRNVSQTQAILMDVVKGEPAGTCGLKTCMFIPK